MRELSGALFSLSPAKLKQVAQWIEQLVVHSEDCKGMTRLSSRLPPSCLSAKYLLCFICQATSPLDISVAREVCEVLQHRKLEKSIRSFAKHQPILDGKSLAEFPVEVTPINSSGDFCHITVDIPGNPHDVKLWLVREIHDSFMKNMKTSIIIFQGYQRTELTSSNICTLFFLIPSRIASNLLKEVDSVLAKLPVCGILRIGIMDTSHHSELGFVQVATHIHVGSGLLCTLIPYKYTGKLRNIILLYSSCFTMLFSIIKWACAHTIQALYTYILEVINVLYIVDIYISTYIGIEHIVMYVYSEGDVQCCAVYGPELIKANTCCIQSFCTCVYTHTCSILMFCILYTFVVVYIRLWTLAHTMHRIRRLHTAIWVYGRESQWTAGTQCTQRGRGCSL